MSTETLKEKMREFAEGKRGVIKLSSADFSDAGGSGDSKDKAGPTKGTVMVDVPQEAKDDAFTRADATADAHQSLLPSYIEDKIDISEEERTAFLQALVTGGRYERSFSLFGGKLTGVFRCRKIAESDGIMAWLSHNVNHQKLDARIEYMSLMRNAILAAQVKSLRGIISEDFPEMAEPYGPTRSEDGKTVTPPAWLALADSWGARPEALATAIHAELQKFERRYWAMVMDASNQNFWNPAASI